MFTPKFSNILIDFKNPATSAANLVTDAQHLITLLLNAERHIQSNALNPNQFPFSALPNSGLSKKIGLYAIVNIKTQKMYLGVFLSQRKGDHYRAFKNPAKTSTRNRLSQPMLADLQSGSINDFCFVPILILNSTQVSNLSTGNTLNQQVNDFLDKQVEQPLLNTLLASNASNIYNTRAVGAFVAGNKAGGSPASGSPNVPFSYTLNYGQNPPREYAWESVSAGAKCFCVTTKAVRFARDNAKKVKEITTTDFDSFKGTKITNINAATFATTNKADFDLLVRQLFPRKANELGVP